MQDTLKDRTIFCRDSLEVLQGINTNLTLFLDHHFKKKIFTVATIGNQLQQQ